MELTTLLKGKIVNVKTEVGVTVQLEIEKVTKNNHSEELAPSTKENDYWPPTRDWSTYTVQFTNGNSKTYSTLEEIDIVEP